MACTAAIIVVPAEPGPSGVPMLLERVLFQPLLRWNVEALKQFGVTRFLLVVPEDARDSVQSCCPEAEVLTDRNDPRLKAFAMEQEGTLAVLDRAVWLSFYGAAVLTQAEQLPWGGGGYTGVFRSNALWIARDGLDGLRPGDMLFPDGSEVPMLMPASADTLEDIRYNARCEKLAMLEDSGVQLLDRETVYCDPQVSIGAGTMILPNVILRGDTVIGRDCELGPNSTLMNSRLGDRVTIESSRLDRAEVHSGTTVGPWSNLRPGTVLEEEVHVGDFVELKNTTVGRGTWVSHLTYLGDAEVGERCNFGCGVVTANFDGEEKYRTVIGSNAFIGCNTNLIAPVTVEEGGYTAAGTTVTDTVPARSLAIGRVRQENKEGWAEGRVIKF